MRKMMFLAIVVSAVVVVAGCGGSSKTHWIDTPYHGSIEGVEMAPPDGDSNVGVDTWIEVYWPDPYHAPPYKFSFRLEKEIATDRFEPVKTFMVDESSVPEHGIWWFAPEDDLQADAVYRIYVADSYGGHYRAYFLTEAGRSRSLAAAAAKSYKPVGAKDAKPSGLPAVEHTITTERK